MSIFDDIIKNIERGREGLNEGLPMGFNRLVEYLPNIQQGTYYLTGASAKVGKTSFVDDAFMYNPFDYLKNNKDSNITLDIDYFSYEIEKKIKITKGISRALWKNTGLIADVNTILSRGRNYCEDELFNQILKYKTYFDELEDIVTIHDMPDNATGIYKYLINKAKSNGKLLTRVIGKSNEGIEIKRFDKYIPNEPNKYWIVIIDHISLLKEERGFSTKQNIDKMSQYLVELRNNFNIIPVVIQQLSFDVDNDERQKSGRLTPTLRDFGDSKYTTRDANVILALYDPYRDKQKSFQGYDITKLGNSFRNLEILQNRDGEPGINIGLNFIGPVGTFRELPKAADMKDKYYEKARNYLI
jgi:replicative DNA helicase